MRSRLGKEDRYTDALNATCAAVKEVNAHRHCGDVGGQLHRSAVKREIEACTLPNVASRTPATIARAVIAFLD